MQEIYGLGHVLYLVVSIFIFASTLTLIKKRVVTDKETEILVRILGGILLSAVLINRITICIEHQSLKVFFPDSYCGASSLALGVAALVCKKDSKVFHCVAYIGFIGGFLTMVYPDFIEQDASLFYPPTITGLLHHTLLVYVVIVLIMTGYMTPSLKKWYLLPLGLNFYILFGVALITLLGYSDAMYLFNPVLPDTIFNWFVLGLMVLPTHAVFLFLWEYFMKRNAALTDFEEVATPAV